MFSDLVSKRTKRFILIFVLVFCVFLFLGCASLIYPTFSHQGRLLDNSGQPVADGNYSVVYRLYHDQTGGTAVYTDTQTVAVTDGYFNSSFGDSGADPKIFSEQTWLEITIDGETLAPRQLLRGAPYASGLVAGSAAIGSQPVTYTRGSYDNLGSAFFAANTDTSGTGGSGLTAVTSAQIPDGEPIKTDVAAVRGLAADSDMNATTGAYAGIFVSDSYSGMYVEGAGGSTFSAYFNGNLFVTGNCFGCLMAMTAQNIGDTEILLGDFVTAVGVNVDPDYGVPVLLVEKAVPGDAILGVAVSPLNRVAYNEDELTHLGFELTEGAAAPQAYLSVIAEGLAHARMPDGAQLTIGDYVTMTGSGVAKTQAIDESFAQVMSETDKNGLTWILLNR